MVSRERAVDFAVQDDVLTRQLVEQGRKNVAGYAVAVVPDNLQLAVAAVVILQKAFDILFLDIDGFHRALCFGNNVAFAGQMTEMLDLLTEERLVGQHHLEAVVVGRVVAARDHDRAIRLQRDGCEIQHRVGPRPIRITSAPEATAPLTSASSRDGEDTRPS